MQQQQVGTRHYFELELPPNADLYKGEVRHEALDGLALYYNKKSKLLIIGVINGGTASFEGSCIAYDFSQAQDPQGFAVVYYGQMKNSMKSGLGVLQKQKVTYSQIEKQLIAKVNNKTYMRIIQDQIEVAERQVERAKAKVKKLQGMFMSAPLKDLIKTYNGETSQEKKSQDQSSKYYIGEFQEDRRHGWGIHYLKNGVESYKGQFEKDLMQGRGIYKFGQHRYEKPPFTIKEIQRHSFSSPWPDGFQKQYPIFRVIQLQLDVFESSTDQV